MLSNSTVEQAHNRSLALLGATVVGLALMGCIDEATSGVSDFDTPAEPSFRVASVGHVPSIAAPSRIAARRPFAVWISMKSGRRLEIGGVELVERGHVVVQD